VLRIIGTLALTFELFGERPICFRIVSGSGIPGVGVVPFFTPRFNSSGLGMPGVGVVPFCSGCPFTGMPGMGLPFTGSGLAESPGGMFAGSRTVVFTPPLARFELALLDVVPPQPSERSAHTPMIKPNICFNIKNKASF
jgi:hypothetical protein